MIRYSLLLLLALAPVCLGEAARPNIVLILADDLGYETVGSYGGTSYATPNLDRLAASGIRFDHAYAMPLCTNTRIQLMTGKYNNRNWKAFGILDPCETTFGHLMQRAGYKTCIAGKWQLRCYDPPGFPGAQLRRDMGMRAQDAGFDEYCLWHTGHTEEKGSRYADPVIDQNGKLLTDTKGKYGPDIWADFVNDFMTRHRQQPFFVYYPMALPHNPMVPTPDSPEWADPAKRSVDETRFAADMIRYTDKVVGRVVQKIDELGLRENTLILFFSDNGTNWRVASMMGDRRVRGGKGQGSDLGIRVPMMASWKGATRAGQVSTDLIDSVDFLPTILDAAGATELIPEPIDGVSFLSTLKGNGKSHRQWVYVHQDPRPGWDKDRFALIRLARDQRYKLFEDGRLFCTRDDPLEESPIFLRDDSDASRAARNKLQNVLDSMKPYPMFDPDQMPRPNPSDSLVNHEFQDQGGYIVAEAEMIPTPRDESWLAETSLTEYTGVGYLRALRDQPAEPQKGAAVLRINAATSGDWNLAFRCRSDHLTGQLENDIWVKVGDGPWLVGTTNKNAGNWQWVTELSDPKTGQQVAARFAFTEKRNEIRIAPRSHNLKVDRIVCYEDDRESKALDPRTPASEFHPWASP